MKDVLALILAGGRVDELSVLTLFRPKSVVPFGGMFRVIDFPLSNLMYSGVERVGVLCQYRSLALNNHVGVGSWWDFLGRDRGATMLMPTLRHSAGNWYKGTADAVYQNIEFIQENKPDTIMILSGDHVYKMDYISMHAMHKETDADLTIAFAPIDPNLSHRFGAAEIDTECNASGGRVLKYREKDNESKLEWASLTIYMFKPEVLYSVLKDNSLNSQSHEFGRDIIPKMLENYKVYGYNFGGYWGYSKTIDEYWETNMALLGDSPEIVLEGWKVRTNLDHDRLRDRAPAQIGAEANIRNSLIQNGCEIDGEVESSILFPGVKVKKGAVVKNSIIFSDNIISFDAKLDYTITDFDVTIGAGTQIGLGNNSGGGEHSELGITLIGKGTAVPRDIVIGKGCVISPGLTEKHFQQKEYKSGSIL